MADIAATDLTYTQISKEITDSSIRKFTFTVAFGDGALTYPANGVPLTAGKLGCPNQIRVLNIFSPASASGKIFKYDAANNKIRIYQSGAITPTGTVATHTHTVPAGTDASGGTTGTTAPVFTGAAAAAASLAELGNVAVSATTLYVEVSGW